MQATESFTSDTADRPLPLRDHAVLREALWASETPTLLMVYTHLTGDEAFLDSFAPYLRSPMVGPSEVPVELDRELRERLFKRLTETSQAAEVALSHELFM